MPDPHALPRIAQKPQLSLPFSLRFRTSFSDSHVWQLWCLQVFIVHDQWPNLGAVEQRGRALWKTDFPVWPAKSVIVSKPWRCHADKTPVMHWHMGGSKPIPGKLLKKFYVNVWSGESLFNGNVLFESGSGQFEAPIWSAPNFCTSRLPSRYMVQASGATAKPLAWFQLADEKAAHLELLAALRCEGLKWPAPRVPWSKRLSNEVGTWARPYWPSCDERLPALTVEKESDSWPLGTGARSYSCIFLPNHVQNVSKSCLLSLGSSPPAQTNHIRMWERLRRDEFPIICVQPYICLVVLSIQTVSCHQRSRSVWLRDAMKKLNSATRHPCAKTFGGMRCFLYSLRGVAKRRYGKENIIG